jgi:hypothetical protein
MRNVLRSKLAAFRWSARKARPDEKSEQSQEMKMPYGIPNDVLRFIKARDTNCVYCRVEMTETTRPFRADNATIEHLNHLPTHQFSYENTVEMFAMACRRCNCNLRKNMPLTPFLAKYGFTETCAPVVKAYLKRPQASWPICEAA